MVSISFPESLPKGNHAPVQLETADVLMVALYVVFIVGLGFYFAKRTKTTDAIGL